MVSLPALPVSMLTELAGARETVESLTALIGPEAVARLATAYSADERQAAIDNDPQLMLIAARWTVRVLGWPVFPLKPRSKVPFDGSRGFKDATTDLAQVEWIWGKHCPQANIGVPTGVAFDCIDVDGLEGFHSLAAVQATPGNVLGGIFAVASTGRPDGGQHLYLPADPRRRNRTELLPGLDTRATGGYVVIPPSLHESGRRYRWITPPTRGAHTVEQAA